ncbi:hypothetical protein [Bizionia arctica]|nr:hypothetical protein [Bizionia arctica]
MILICVMSCLYAGLVSCDPEVINDTIGSDECCGNLGDLPPPPPPTTGG